VPRVRTVLSTYVFANVIKQRLKESKTKCEIIYKTKQKVNEHMECQLSIPVL